MHRKQDISLVYLMNDAVESFLVFHNATITGQYKSEYEGGLLAVLDKKRRGVCSGRASGRQRNYTVF